MDKNITDNEIISALKKVLEIMCVMGDLQKAATVSNALDLINRLQVENDNLKNGFFQKHYKEQESQELLSVREAWRKAQMDYIKLDAEWEGKYKTAKVEAYKEFAEKLKRRLLNKNEVINNIIDNLLKELVGDKNGNAG